MSIHSIHSTLTNHLASTSSALKTASTNAATTFSATLESLASSIGVTSSDVRQFFAQAPDATTIAQRAASLGLTKEQVTQFLDQAAYGGADHSARVQAVESFLSDHASSFKTDTQGRVVSQATKATVAANANEKAMPAAADIKAFFASRPTEDQVTAKAKALGLNAGQFVQFRVIGGGMDIQAVSAPVLETLFVDSANRLGQDIGGGKHGGWTSYYAPKLGRAITKDEISSFFATNPSRSEIFKKSAELGLSVSAVNNMMVGIGITKSEDANKAYATMDYALYKGTDGFSKDAYGHIVAGGGHIERFNSDGSSTWVAYAGDRPASA